MTATFYVGDVLKVLSALPENSVDLVLTSPPFLALRSYLPVGHPDKALEGGSQATPGEYIDWLLDVVEALDRVLAPHDSICLELGDTYAGSGGAGGDYDPNGLRDGQPKFRQTANWGDGKWSDGAQSTRSSGSGKGPGWPLPKSLSLIPESFRFAMVYGQNPFTGRQTERWRLRNVIRWVRPNPPVGALGDKFRPATSELMVFCKSAKRYFDLDAVRTEHKYPETVVTGVSGNKKPAEHHPGTGWTTDNNIKFPNPAGAPPLDWWNIPLLEGEEPQRVVDTPKGKPDPHDKHRLAAGGHMGTHELGAPPLDWWNIPPGGYEGAHYAVWPPELLIKPIKAMCPEQVCRTCGEARRRVSVAGATEGIGSLISQTREIAGLSRSDLHRLVRGGHPTGIVYRWEMNDCLPMAADWVRLKEVLALGDSYDHLIPDRDSVTYTPQSGPGRGTTGLPPKVNPAGRGFEWHEATRQGPNAFTDCGHNDYRPGLVLDCFGGSGTTAAVATGHGRDCILIDLDERNFDLALERVGPLVLQRGEVAA